MEKRFVSLWFRHLTTDWLTLRQPELRAMPFVLVAAERNRVIVKAANILAETEGIKVGMAAADAKAIVTNLQVLDDLPGNAAKLLTALGEWCIRYSPQIAVDMPDGLILDVAGCTHLWGTEHDYLKDLVVKLRSKGYDVRGAMADTIGTAWAIARFGRDKPIIAAGKQADALVALPSAALRLSPVILDRLQKLGFYTIKSFITTARSALRRRFGQGFLQRIDQALGNEDEPLQLLHPPEPYLERLPCLEPIRTRPSIEIAIKILLENMCKRLAAEGKGVRTAILKGYRLDGGCVQAIIGTNRASHQADHLFKLFELKIDTIKPKLGIELFTLEVPKVDDVEPEQEVLWSPEGCGLANKSLAELLDKLANKIGAASIHRYLPQERYWPEQSVIIAASVNDKPNTFWPQAIPRPLMLLPKPEQIEVTALLPDNPPIFFLYKGNRHIIKKADDAERIEREWWLDQGQHRDYYVVEDQHGNRYWVFRSGHYEPGQSQWYIHGFFA